MYCIKIIVNAVLLKFRLVENRYRIPFFVILLTHILGRF